MRNSQSYENQGVRVKTFPKLMSHLQFEKRSKFKDQFHMINKMNFSRTHLSNTVSHRKHKQKTKCKQKLWLRIKKKNYKIESTYKNAIYVYKIPETALPFHSTHFPIIPDVTVSPALL